MREPGIAEPRAERVLLGHPDAVPAGDRVVEGGHGGGILRAHLVVDLPEEAERLIVEAEEQVNAVLLDALAVEPAAGAGALAAEQPVLLVDGDVEGTAERRVGQHPRGRERAHPPSQDRDVDLLRGPWHESSLRG